MKKSIFKRIGLIALAVCVAIGSFFVPVTKKEYNSASAIGDTTINNTTFNSSNILISRMGNTSASLGFDSDFSSLLSGNDVNAFQGVNTMFYSWSFRLILDPNYSSSGAGLTFSVKGVFSQSSNYGLINRYEDFDTPIVDGYVNVGTVVDFIDRTFSSYNLCYPVKINTSEGVKNSLIFTAFSNPDGVIPTLDMVTIEICSGLNCPYISELVNSPDISNSNIVVYTDTAGCKYLFAIPNWYPLNYPDVSSAYYDYRIYYTKETFNYDDNQIYQQGYNEGLADNQQNIYNNGYNAGFDVGFGQGRQDGIIEANDYSFISLIGAVVDVPVQTIRGMLNFTFLGINLFDFLMGLIAILVILFIVKLVRGG